RNGMDPEYGLMYGVQGASYNHNHNNGMAMELYGMGTVMGIDAGTGPTYEHPLHQTYYSQWAAHNTVVAAGSSSSVPWSGGAGRKNIGEIELTAMEPMADRPAVSPSYSFTTTEYDEKSTGTRQSRTLALVRTSEKSGYYVDIYRSDNKQRNDYVYHNIGDNLVLMSADRKEIPLKSAEYPVVGKDYPGFRYFSKVKKLEGFSENLIALFSGKNEDGQPVFMQVLVPGKDDRTYFTANSLHVKTAGRQYMNSDPPVFTMMDKGESANKPFLAVFEPFGGSANGYTVERIETTEKADSSGFTLLYVYNRNQSHQMIFQSIDANKLYISGEASFTGSFGVVDFSAENVKSIYLGEGELISYEGYSLKPSSHGSANMELRGNELMVSCNQPTEIGLPVKLVKKAVLKKGSTSTVLKTKKNKGTAIFIVPAVMNGTITLQ
ncbi:MAG TPA: heparinase II/III family protein, partial [Bacteroidales bacterium]|nr:heparinase II/III family protein [Bacteroidales bacterium]